tara:strand:+ start:181 stop:1050 length:870 start_codon:yes stop_codon:yes gene_type:complete
MKFFADTASLEDIKYCFSRKVNEGITTNPKIIESTGDLSVGFEQACKNILAKYYHVPVSLETDLRGIDVNEIHDNPEKVRDILLDQACNLASWGKNVVVKIPCCEGGTLATKILSENNILTNYTACMTPFQALQAAKAGATYVSLFANRMLDSHILDLAGFSLKEKLKDPNWKQTLKENQRFKDEAWNFTLAQISYVAKELEQTDSSLIVGSIRTPEDIHKIAKAEPQIITIPTKIVKGLENIEEIKKTKRDFYFRTLNLGSSIQHPMTQYTLEEFEKAADSYRKIQNE